MAQLQTLEELLGGYPSLASSRSNPTLKPDGTIRRIVVPNAVLSQWQKHVLEVLNTLVPEWPLYIVGGVRGRSIKQYAQPHVGKDCVVQIDVKNCFDSITVESVSAVLTDRLHLDPMIGHALAIRLTKNGRLAQGFPTSSFISNLYLWQALEELVPDLELESLDLTCYVDDIAMSGSIPDAGALINRARQTLAVHGLAISKVKTRIMRSSGPQSLSGISVNRKLRLTKQRRKELMSLVAHGALGKVQLLGHISYAAHVDPVFGRRLKGFALKKGLLTSSSNPASFN